MHRRLRRLAPLAALLALVLPTAAHAALRLGLQDDALLTSGEQNAWPLATELAPSIVRYNVGWEHVAPQRPVAPDDLEDPAYQWAPVDDLARHVATLGADSIFSLVDSPAWANGGRGPAWAPLSADDYGRFCGLVARRYSGTYTPPDADQPLPAVTRYTVWNEPNRGQYFLPQGVAAPRRYAALAAACGRAIHAANPAAVVAIGPLASRGAEGGLAPLDFLRAYQLAGGPRPQAVAVNPYLERLLPAYRPHELTAGGAITIRNLDVLQRALRASYHATLPVWITEFGIRTAVQPGLGLITPARQAALALQSIRLVQQRYRYVPYLVWYLLRDVSPTSYWRSGLVTYGWQPKPLFGLLRSLSSRPA